jgi:murein DD-endopeptidase MepM/ murein hydrolase activator NlpD
MTAALILAMACTGCGGDQADVTVLSAVRHGAGAQGLYGFGDSLLAIPGTLRENDFLSTILGKHGVDQAVIGQVASNSRDVFDVRKFRAGNTYSILCTHDSLPRCFVYEINDIEFVVYELTSPGRVYKGEKDVKLISRSGSGVISGSLWQNMRDAGLNPVLALMLSDIFAWSVDFYRLQDGDQFKVIYQEKSVAGKRAGIGDITAAWMTHGGEQLYAFRFAQDGTDDYFNDSAKSLRKAFLIAPVQYSRIASRYTTSRYHPILHYHRPHLGTDYSAPHGTPIWATGDGTVTEAGYKGGNGNYVKIRHNSTYETQYLHLSRFASGIRAGTRVKQGEVIGYVGSTGLSTGPHVCYRFWKHGKQVDHLKEKFPAAEPVKQEYLEAFMQLRDSMKAELDGIELTRP